MKERPILFSAPMVRALLDGSKTQTRRIVKLPHLNPLGKWEAIPWGGPNGGRTREGHTVPFQNVIGHSRTGEIIGCPHGQPGDQLWVKETWRTAASLDSKSPSAIGAMCVDAGYRRPWAPLAYEADGHRNSEWRGFEICGDAEPGKTRVSIHMPRWASRIALEITGVRVERLQDISEADALAEGTPGGHGTISGYGYAATPIEHYRWLWESLNAAGRPALPANPKSQRYARVKAWLDKHPDTTSWAANPWVWVIEFRRAAAGAGRIDAPRRADVPLELASMETAP